MAKLICFALYDSKLQAFCSPFQMRTKGEAVRALTELVNDSNTTVSKHPEDFALMELGFYDESNGQFENHVAPLNLGLASQYKNTPVSPTPLFNRENNV